MKETETKCVNCGCSTPVLLQTATVSDEAVQAALDKWHGLPLCTKDAMRAALTAALPHLALSAAPCSVEVKKLEWFTAKGHVCDKMIARDCFGNEFCRIDLNGKTEALISKIKTKAQSDFDRRILSQIVTKPVDAIDKEISETVFKFLALHDFIDEDCEYSASDILEILQENCEPISIDVEIIAGKAADVIGVTPYSDMRLSVELAVKWALSNLPFSPAKPVDVAAVREQALEEAAMLSGDVSRHYRALKGDELGNTIKSNIAYDIAVAIRALSPAEPVDQWQDIATAPQNGTQFLAALSNGWIVILSEVERGNFAWYHTSSRINIPVARTHPRDSLKESIIATHWMPLPAAPASKGGE